MADLERHYKTFCNDLSDIFDKDWAKVEDKFITGYRFLSYIPVLAWKPMVKIAVDSWDNWPRNWVKAVNGVYEVWRIEEKVQRVKTQCDSCNSVGFFEAGKRIEVKPNQLMTYWYVWRCEHCANWMGVLGTKIPASTPQAIINQGFEVRRFPKPLQGNERQFDLSDLTRAIGIRVNPPQPRPAIQTYNDDIPF